MLGLMVGSFPVLWPWPDGVGIITDDTTEAVDGTLLEWPDGDAFWPIALGAMAFTAVLVVSMIGARATRHEASPQELGVGD